MSMKPVSYAASSELAAAVDLDIIDFAKYIVEHPLSFSHTELQLAHALIQTERQLVAARAWHRS